MLYRLGRYSEAAETLTFLSADIGRATATQDRMNLAEGDYLLAMTLYRLGQHAQAHRRYSEAAALNEQLQEQLERDRGATQTLTAPWLWLVELDTVAREAKALIGP
jgi:hypothetical protein